MTVAMQTFTNRGDTETRSIRVKSASPRLCASAVWLIVSFSVVTPAFSSQQVPADIGVIEPARPGLRAVVLPPLDDLEPAVAGQLREARQDVERVGARSGGRNLAEAYGALAQALHVYEFFEPAEAAYRNSTRLEPDEVRWLHLLGYLYQQTGRLDEAAGQFAAARRLQPDNHPAVVRLGEVYLGLNRLREARDAFQDILMVFPAASRKGLGEVALRERRFEEAAAHFRAALERVPQASSIHYSLAMAYRGMGQLDDARRHLEQRGTGDIKAVDPIVEALQSRVRGERPLVMLGRRAFDAGQFTEAAELFRRAVETAPDSAAARVNLGLAQAQLGNLDDAASQFQAVLATDPANLTARTSLGMLLVDRGRLNDAVDHLRTAFGQTPSDRALGSSLVSALLRLGRDDEAISVLKSARALDTENEDTLVGLSILLASRERYREAIVLLEDGHRDSPDRRPTATTLARLLASSPDLSVRDGRRALELATAVHGAEPTPVHSETVAMALAELGRCAEAREWMARAVAEAERAKDDEEAARLRGEAPRYEGASCRPGR